jgi:hypothetical protein
MEEQMKKLKCKVERHWELELPRWEGVVIMPDKTETKTGIIRTSYADALQDAQRLAEELENGITGR